MKAQMAGLVQIGLILVAITATASFATDVKTDYDHAVNFGQYATYTWDKVRVADEYRGQQIKSAVNAAIAGKLWTQVAAGGDISISATEIERSHRRNLAHNRSTTIDSRYEVDTLEIDLFDAKTNNLIWRGTVSDTLSNSSEQNIGNLDKGVQKLFEHFPPQTKK